MRAIFCGNFEFDARESDLERLFRRYGKVERVDMKTGFAFIYMKDERDADDAVRALDGREFGRKGRNLRVEWTKQERGIRKPEGPKRNANTRPSKTLFVINFDQYNTKTRDLERHFDSYGKIVSARIRKNFGFVQFETQEDATRALESTNRSKLADHVITVEYAVRDDDEKKNGYSPRDRSLDRGHDRDLSPAPSRRERLSPDYGRRRSPSPYKRERASPDYGRRPSLSPHKKQKVTPEYARNSSSKADPENGRISNRRASSDQRSRSRSPHRRERVNPDHHREPSHSNRRASSDHRSRSRSPHRRERVNPDHHREPSHSPHGRRRGSPDHVRDVSSSPYGKKMASPNHLKSKSGRPHQLERPKANYDLDDVSPNVRSEKAGSRVNNGDESPTQNRSTSPASPIREESQSE